MGGGGQSTNTIQRSDPWEAQAPYLQRLFADAERVYGQNAPDISGSTAIAQQGVDSLLQTADTNQGYLQDVLNSSRFLTSGDVLSPDSNPALQQYIDLSNQAITRNYTEGILPQLTSGAAATGNIGSSRQGVAEALSARGTTDAVQRNTAQLANEAYGRGLNAYVAGLGLAPSLAASQSLPSEQRFAASQVQRGIEEAPEQQQLQRMRDFQGFIGGNYGGTTNTQGTVPGANPVTTGIGAGLATYAAFGNPYTAAAAAVASYLATN